MQQFVEIRSEISTGDIVDRSSLRVVRSETNDVSGTAISWKESSRDIPKNDH